MPFRVPSLAKRGRVREGATQLRDIQENHFAENAEVESKDAGGRRSWCRWNIAHFDVRKILSHARGSLLLLVPFVRPERVEGLCTLANLPLPCGQREPSYEHHVDAVKTFFSS
jgi:hypothetical protein